MLQIFELAYNLVFGIPQKTNENEKFLPVVDRYNPHIDSWYGRKLVGLRAENGSATRSDARLL